MRKAYVHFGLSNRGLVFILVAICLARSSESRSDQIEPLRLSLSTPQSIASPGDTLSYCIEYCNVSESTVFGVVINDAIPARTTYVAGSANGQEAIVSLSSNGVRFGPPPNPSARHIRWQLNGPLTANTCGTLSFKVLVE